MRNGTSILVLFIVASSAGISEGGRGMTKLESEGEVLLERQIETSDGESIWAFKARGAGIVKVEPKKERRRANEDGVWFYSARLRPAFDERGGGIVRADFGGAKIGYQYKKAIGMAELVMLRGKKVAEEWVGTGVYYPVGQDGAMRVHSEVVIMIDSGAREWRLFSGSRIVGQDLPWVAGKEGISIEVRGNEETSVSNLWYGDENPLFVDEDRNGVPDDGFWEREMLSD